MIHLVLREPIAYQKSLCQELSNYYRGDLTAWFVTGDGKDFNGSETFERHFLSQDGFTKLFKALRTDHDPILILGSWSSTFAYKVLSVATTLGVPTFIWADHPHPRARSPLFERSRKLYLSLLSKKISGFLACGKPTVDYLAALGIPRENIFNFPYWVNVPAMWSLPSGCDEAHRNDPLRLIAIGRLVCEKKFDVAIAAVGLANQRIGRVIAELLIVGDGPERANLTRQVEANSLDEAITFAGRLDNREVFEKLRTADALVAPSQFEGYGVVVLEALAEGRTVFASNQVTAALDKDNGSGAILLHSLGNIDQLAGQIEHVASDRISLAERSRSARAIAENSKLEKAPKELQSIFDARLDYFRKTKNGSSVFTTLADRKPESTTPAQ